MNEQTISFVLKLRVLHPNADSDSAPLLRGSLLRVGAAEGQHFHSLERLLEILSSSMNHMAVEMKREESICESHGDE